MASLLEYLNNFIWNEQFWLGDDAQWDDFISSDPSIYYPKVTHMNWSIVIGILLMFVRPIFESFVIIPFANCLGLKERKNISLKESPPLEAAYKSYKAEVPYNEIKRLSKETNLTERQIQRWFYKKRLMQMPSLIYKFKECSWQAFFYSITSCYWLYTLWDKPWMWVTVNCWIGWPKQHVDNHVFILYLAELSFYWNLLFEIYYRSNYHQKDKKQMVLHHFATITLIYFSWGCNFVRGGSLVLLVHDFADPWLNMTKMAKYLNRQTACEILFVFLLISWIFSRCIIYPYWIMYLAVVEILDYVTTSSGYWLTSALLILLQILHFIWTYMLITTALQKFTSGSIKKDSRSESDNELSDSTNEETLKNSIIQSEENSRQMTQDNQEN
ncbi:ceramide synthase 2 [Biomphalaria pfeifferi]|uniref:Ceramide synthase 2 n=1 Tax=Biomphalaria pfeifferi TaxID=112525 RepID=A0AAD8CCU9_BIOPF|nr:ceramide synthase 2 [Biomphalaria pfeifferi]